jgi:hypothetical protein
MVAPIVRFIKRLLVLVPGLVVTYFVAMDFYPYLNRRTSAALALFLAYVITAYIFIPALIRLLNQFIYKEHIPLYCTTPDGFASDPVNIGLVGTRKQLIQAMTDAGWHRADKRTIRTSFRMLTSFVLRQQYPTAPFSNLFLFGRRQDIGFEIPLDSNPRHRHHVRFWAASHTGDPRLTEHVSFWARFHRSELQQGGRVLWVGAASLDTGLGFIRHNAQVTHMVHPNTDRERDLIVKQLKKTKHVKRYRKVKIGIPYRLTNRVFRAYLQSDGKMAICEL